MSQGTNNMVDWERKASEYKEEIDFNPKRTENYTRLAECLLNLHRLQEALAVYNSALVIYPTDASLFSTIGRTLAESGYATEGVPYCERAIILQPHETHFYNNLGAALEAADQYHDALQVYLKAVRIDADLVSAHIRIGMLLVQLKQYTEAIVYCQNVLKLFPNHLEALLWLAIAYFRDEQDEQAVELFQKVEKLIKTEPYFIGTPVFHHQYGVALQCAGQFMQAIPHLEEACHLDPSNFNALDNLGIAYFETGNYAAAVTVYQKSLRLVPDDSDTYALLGQSLYALNQFEEAAEVIQMAIHHAEEPAAFKYIYLGHCFLKQGLYDQAAGAFRRAIEISPDKAEAHYYLGLALKNQGQIQEARAEWEITYTLDDKDYCKLAKKALKENK
jgi:tetratricopeptide (TPR) repeat protein